MSARFKQVWRYVIPSVAALVVTQLYVVVDGIFVGQGVGVDALGAINLAYPFIATIHSVTFMFTVGGATITAIHIGRGQHERANQAFMVSAFMVLVFSTAISAIGVLFPHAIVRMLGANDFFLEDAAEYLRYFCMFTVFDCAGILLSNFVRNDGRPGLSFLSMVAGAAVNIFLDWLFVFPLRMGLKGAAIATGLGQTVSIAMLLSHFIRRRGILRIGRFTPSLAGFLETAKRGLPEFITQLGQPITVLCYNIVAIRYLGELAVSAYSVIMYISSVVVAGVFVGISQGLQPLIGQSYGRGESADTAFYFRAGMVINLALSVLIYAAFIFGGRGIISLFNPDAELNAAAYGILIVYGFSFIFASANIVFNTYFFSTEATWSALTLAVLRGVVLNTLFAVLFPRLLGASSMWYAIVAAELLTVGVGIVMKRRAGREIKVVRLPKEGAEVGSRA